MVAQGVAVSPSLIYISESGSAGIAIGANIVSLTPFFASSLSHLLINVLGTDLKGERSLASGQAAHVVSKLNNNLHACMLLKP